MSEELEKDIPQSDGNPTEEVKKKSGVWIYNLAIVACVAVFLVAAFFLGQWLYENYKTKQLADQLQSMVGVSESTVTERVWTCCRRWKRKSRCGWWI